MKILVIQLARLGDIYLSWPTLRALHRQFPEAKIDLIVRKTYQAATEGLGGIHRVLAMDSQSILEPLIRAEVDVAESVDRMTSWLEILRRQDYDRVINLSFSPLSSFITHYLSSEKTVASGYSRHADGTFYPIDDVSAYFYAQVGPEKSNRIHLTTIFAGVAGVELEGNDWNFDFSNFIKSQKNCDRINKDKSSILIHIGGSQVEKSLAPGKWANVILRMLERTQSQFILMGDERESQIGSEVESIVANSDRVINLVGKTTLVEVFDCMNQASLLIGGDSAPIHMASLVGLPTLNISFPCVQFWETGPRAEGSEVLWGPSREQVASDQIAAYALGMLEGNDPIGPRIRVSANIEGYSLEGYPHSTFAWDLIQAIYMDGVLPAPVNPLTWQAIQNLHAMNELCSSQVQALRDDPRSQTAIEILNEADRVFGLIYRMAPEIRPLLDWYRTEKIRLGPGSFSDILHQTEEIHRQLNLVTSGLLEYLVLGKNADATEEVEHGCSNVDEP